MIVAGCSSAEQPATVTFTATGRLEDVTILEASGLARSQRQSDLLWIINDNGAKELVHAISSTGTRRGEFDLKKSKNRDWEDLASFRLNDIPYLMVADIGDNEAKHKRRTLYFVEEPEHATEEQATLAWQLDFRYPEGPRDAESAAIDIENQRVLILSKRDVPPVLYSVPLRPDSEKVLTATRLGVVTSLPTPKRRDLDSARQLAWYWQPVGMDISQDNLAAVILTYRAVYYYERLASQDWLDAINGTPIRIGLGNFKNAEAVAFGDHDRTIVVTGENKHSLVLSVDMRGATQQ